MLSCIAFIPKRPTDHVLYSSSPHECHFRPIVFNNSLILSFHSFIFIRLGLFPDSLCSAMIDIARLVQFLLFVCLFSLFPTTFTYITHVLLYSLNQIFPARLLTHIHSELVSLIVILSSLFATVDLVV